MKRYQKVLLAVVGGIVLLCVVAIAVAHAIFTEERILAALSPRIGEAVNRPVHIGAAGISFRGGVGVWLGDITIGNREGFSDEPLLTLHRFDLKARFWPLLVGRVDIDHLELVSPSVLLEYNQAGESNFTGLVASDTTRDFTRPVPDDGEAPAAPLAVRRVIISDGSFTRRFLPTGERLDVAGVGLDILSWPGDAPERHNFRATLTFDSAGGSGDVPGEGWSITEGGPRFFLTGEWDGSSRSARVDSLALEWWGALLSAQGVVRRFPGLTEIQINARLRTTPLGIIAANAASVYGADHLAGLEGRVQGEMVASFFWPLPEGTVPEWRLDLDLEDLRWPVPGSADELTVPRLEVRGEEQALSWSSPAGRLGSGTISLSGTIDRLFTGGATVSARLRAAVPLAALREFLADSGAVSADGRIECDLTAFGPLAEWRTARIAGTVRSDRVTVRDTTWAFDSAAVSFNLRSDGERVTVQRLHWRAGASDGTVTGEIDGLVALARSGFDSPDILRARLDVRSPHLNLDQLVGEEAVAFDSLAPDSPTPEVMAIDSAATDTTAVSLIPLLVSGTIQSDTVIYSGLTLSEVRSKYEFKNSRFSVSKIRGRVLGGRLRGKLVWDVSNWERPEFRTEMRADSIEANGFLERYFGWAGGVFGRVTFDGRFTGRGRTASEILPGLEGSGRVDMREGRLEAAPLLAAIGESAGIPGLDKPRSLRDVVVPFRVAGGRIVTDKLRFAADDTRFLCVGSFGMDRTLDYAVTIQPGKSSGLTGILGGGDLKLGVTGTVAEPRVRVDAADAAENILKKLLPVPDDSTAGKAVQDVLQNLLKPKKP